MEMDYGVMADELSLSMYLYISLMFFAVLVYH